jgi:hypothetical protein
MILLVNIRLIRKNLQEVNTLAYFAQMSVTKEKLGALPVEWDTFSVFIGVIYDFTRKY